MLFCMAYKLQLTFSNLKFNATNSIWYNAVFTSDTLIKCDMSNAKCSITNVILLLYLSIYKIAVICLLNVVMFNKQCKALNWYFVISWGFNVADLEINSLFYYVCFTKLAILLARPIFYFNTYYVSKVVKSLQKASWW